MGPVFHGAAVGFSEMAYRDGRKSPVLSILPSAVIRVASSNIDCKC